MASPDDDNDDDAIALPPSKSRDKSKSSSSDEPHTRSTSLASILIKTFLVFLLLLLLVVLAGGVAFALLSNDETLFYNIGLHNKKDHSFINTPHRSRSACNCFSNTNSFPRGSEHCCERTIWRAHKFGTILIGDLFYRFRKGDGSLKIRTKPTPKSPNYTLPHKLDYRHVMVTRNWFDSIVSGYLYHKAGYECTIDYRGADKPRNHSKYFDMEQYYHNKDWDVQLSHVNEYEVPPRNNRSLCTYLQEESQEDGVKVIADFALTRWYKGVVAYHEKAMRKFQENHRNRSLFLCYEDLVDPFQQEQIYNRILAFMFPGRNTSDMHMPAKLKASLKQQQLNHSVYAGGHASTHDPELRARLRVMVEQYDRELFNHTIARSSAVFGCDTDKA